MVQSPKVLTVTTTRANIMKNPSRILHDDFSWTPKSFLVIPVAPAVASRHPGLHYTSHLSCTHTHTDRQVKIHFSTPVKVYSLRNSIKRRVNKDKVGCTHIVTNYKNKLGIFKNNFKKQFLKALSWVWVC